VPPKIRSFSGQHEPHQMGDIDHMQHRLLVDQFAAAYRSGIPQQQASGYAANLQHQVMLRSLERTIAIARQERQAEVAALTRHLKVFDASSSAMLFAPHSTSGEP
jgi:hypothetical protein